jgi:glycine oxidase
MLAPGGEIDSEPELAAMALRSLAMYPEFVRDLEEDSGLPIEFRQCGAIEIGVEDDKARRQAALGIPSEPCQHAHQAARWYPGDAVVDPLSINEALLAACRNRGVEIHEHEPVTEICADGVRTQKGHYASDRVLIAAGAWSSALCAGLPRSYPVRGHLLAWEMEPGLVPAILRKGPTYLFQRESGTVIAGSSMEDAGFDRTIDKAVIEDLHKRAASLLPELAGVKPSNEWNGLRPAADSGPVVGRHKDTNIWTAYGHFRNGILLMPDTAQRIAADFSL